MNGIQGLGKLPIGKGLADIAPGNKGIADVGKTIFDDAKKKMPKPEMMPGMEDGYEA